MKKLCLLILVSGVFAYSINVSAQSVWTPKKTKKKSSKSKIKIDSTKAKSSSQKFKVSKIGQQMEKEYQTLTKAEKAEYNRRLGKMVWIATVNRDIMGDKPILDFSLVEFHKAPVKFVAPGTITKSNFSKYRGRKICGHTPKGMTVFSNTLCPKKAKKRRKIRKRN